MIDGRGALLKGFLVLSTVVGMTTSCDLFKGKGGKELTEMILPDSITAKDSATLDLAIMSDTRSKWHDAPCDQCAHQGEVRIRAIAKTTDIKAHSGPPRRRAVAAIWNNSDEDVTHGPSGFVFKAHRIYVLYVSRAAAPDTNSEWGLTPFAIGHVHAPIGALEACPDGGGYTKTDDANFYNCGDAHATSSGITLVKTAYAAPRRTLLPTIPKRGWISCDPDCCTGAGTYSGPAF